MQLQDWGVTYNELEPHFDRFEKICGMVGKAGNLAGKIQSGGNPFEGARKSEFPLPPMAVLNSALLFDKATRDLATIHFPKPRPTLSVPTSTPMVRSWAAAIFVVSASALAAITMSKRRPKLLYCPA